MKFIIGLGNPGKEHEYTRHNAGFLALDVLAAHLDAPAFTLEKKFNALVTRIESDGETYLLVKPQTYMNDSGIAVQAVLSYYNALPKRLGLLAKKDSDLSDALTIVHDDVDFPLGTVKSQTDRNAGGHNGVTSVIERLKTKNFRRVRIGISGPRKETVPTDKFVLEKFSAAELKQLEGVWPEVMKKILE